MDQGQLCHATEWASWDIGNQPFTDDAVVSIGGLFMGNHFSFCAWHWQRLLDALRSELVENGDDGWLIQHVMACYGERVLDRIRQKAIEDQQAIERRYCSSRVRQRDALALADRLIDGSRVYFIQSGKTGPIKIGVANDVLKRMEALQTGSPYRLRLRASIAGTYMDEHEYHQMFAAHRLQGEWFRPHRALLDEIKAIRAAGRGGEKDGTLF